MYGVPKKLCFSFFLSFFPPRSLYLFRFLHYGVVSILLRSIDFGDVSSII